MLEQPEIDLPNLECNVIVAQVVKVALFLFTIFVGLVLLALAIAVIKFVAELAVRVFVALAGAALIGVSLAAVGQLTGTFDGIATGVVLGSFAFILILASSLGAKASRGAQVGSPEYEVPSMSSTKIARTQFSDEPVERAWARVEREVPSRAAHLAKAGDACATLGKAASLQFDADAFELTSIITTHVPALVEDCTSACEGLSASDAARAWTEVADQLEAMGDRAQKCLQQRRARADEQLAIRKQHVASRLAIFNSAESES